eukprot:5115002-Prymnesium_polylepis.1
MRYRTLRLPENSSGGFGKSLKPNGTSTLEPSGALGRRDFVRPDARVHRDVQRCGRTPLEL